MSKKIDFAHLHTHTDHSVLDGHAQVQELVNHVFNQGQPGLAFTDHGTMTNVYNGWKAVQNIKKEHGVDFFFMPGIEAYVAPGETHRSVHEAVFFSNNSREDKAERSNDVSGGGAYTHLTMLAETTEGMHNLFKLNTMAWHEGQFRKPRMDLESIAAHSKGIIATTACPSGELQTRIRLGQLKGAMEYASKMQDIFGKDNYFLELMDHSMSIDLERRVRGDLMRIAKELKIPLLATNDLHYTRKEDALSHEHMLCIQSGSSMSEQPYDLGGKRFAFGGEEYYAKSTDEMLKIFPQDQYPDAIQNSAEIIRRASATFDYDPSLRPTVEMPEGHDEDSYLREMVMEGLGRKVPAKLHDREYLDRIDKELGILSERRFSSYMLVVSDFTRWAKRQGFYCGPGRGCLSGDTLIPTLYGHKQLRDIKIGDVAFDENGMQVEIPAVYEWDCNEDLIEITSSNGSPIKMTTDHKVLVLSSKNAAKGSKETKWIPANEINIGDFVVMPKLASSANEDAIKSDFTYHTVVKIRMVPSEGKVYDFRVDTTMSYVTESFVVHNSGGGSLVAYLTDITEIDPIPHGLIFERFLNPERDSPPDIDSDFDDVNREKVIAYVRNKYGEEMVAMIITFGTIKAKQAMKDIARIYEEPYSVGETLTKAMPDPVGGKEITLKEAFDPTAKRYPEAEEFRKVANSLDNKNIIPYARGIEGRMRQTGVHAAGVIMSSKPLKDVIPLMMRKKDGMTITQFDYPTCEDLGLIKMDFLGLRNLTVIDKAIRSIKKNHGIQLVAEDIYGSVLTNPDEKTFEYLRTGKTLGIFQLDSGGISNLVKLINVTEFNDISAILALYRPGPMGMNSHIAYADRKNGREPVVPIHPELAEVLEPILGETYGLCVTGDTMIWDATQGKLVRIDSIKEKVENGDFNTFGVDGNGKVISRNVTNWYNNGLKETLEIKTSQGYSLNSSIDHPVFTQHGWIRSDKVQVGDRIAVPNNAFDIEKNENSLEESEARMLGMLIGDGYINKITNTFFNSDPDVMNLMEKLFTEKFTNMKPVRRKYDATIARMDFHAKEHKRNAGITEMNQWFDSLGYTEKKTSSEKFVPEAILQSPNSVLREFVAGLWDTDGHVGKRYAHYKTISRELAYGLRDVLHRLGYVNSIASSPYSSVRGEREAYSVHVYDGRFWDDIVPMLASEKKKSVIKNDSKYSLQEGFPADRFYSRMTQIIREDSDYTIGRPRIGKDAGRKAVLNYINWKHGTTFSVDSRVSKNNFMPMSKLIELYAEHYAEGHDFEFLNTSWTMVSEISETGTQEVFDITVDEVHNFIANGLKISNCAFQEQIQFIAQKVSNYSLGEADILRRAMGKKKKSEMDAQWSKFSEGALGRGYSLEAVQALWDALVPFAEYGFNKSHSAAYALISYLTAYLKANYPAEFMAANLSTLVGDKDKTSLYLHECSQMGIEVLPPSISHSTPDYTPTPDGKILFGLQGIRGVGYEVAESIHEEVNENGAFTDINDFLNRAPASALKTSALEGFAHGGALDGLGLSRRTLYTTLPEVARGFAQSRRKKDAGQFSLFDDVEDSGGVTIEFDNLPEYTKKDKLMFERHMLGLYVSDHPLSGMANMLDNYSDYKIAQIMAGEVAVGGSGFGSDRKKIRIAGVANAVQKKLTRKGQMMGIFEIQDITGTIPCLIFPGSFERLGHKLNNDSIYEVVGSLMQRDDEDIQFAVDDLREITLTEAGKVPFSINVMLSQVTEDALQDLEKLLMQSPGEMPVYLNVKNAKGEVMVYELDEKYNVNATSQLKRTIQSFFGMNSVQQ